MTLEEATNILDRRTTIPGDGYTYEQINGAIDLALSAIHPVSRGQIEQNKRRWEVQTSIFPYYYCSGCGELFEIHSHDKEKYRFCPYCMSPMTDEAVDMVMERLEELKDGSTTD